MGLSKEFMLEIYQRMSDQELIATATNDIDDLTPEAMGALNDELVSRRLKDRINSAIKIQQKAVSSDEFFFYLDLIRRLPCPVCLSTSQLLNGVILSKIVTAILFSSTHREFIIACPDCLKSAIKKSGGVSMALGVVELIKGIVETVRVMKEKENSLSEAESEAPSDSLLYFVQKKIGEIELYRNDQAKLEELVKYANSSFF